MNESLVLFVGIGTVVAIAALLIVAFLQHRTVSALVDVLGNVNANDAVIAAIKGATDGIPQSVFNQALAVASAGKTFAPNDELKALVDQLTGLIERVDNDPSNDPKKTLAQMQSVLDNVVIAKG